MNVTALRSIIAGCCNDVIFTHNGKKAGVTVEVKDFVPTFQAWYGPDTKDFLDVDVLMQDQFFDGRSLCDLVDETEFTVL